LPKTLSNPSWTTSVFSSTVTDLVLIYESVTSWTSFVRWLTLHSWALDSLTNELQQLLVYGWILELSLSLILRPMASQPVYLGIKHQIFFTVRHLRVCLYGALSDERTGLSFTIVASPRHRSHFRVQVPWDSWPCFTVSDSSLPFSSSPTTRRDTVEVFDPASTRQSTLEFKNELSCITRDEPKRDHQLEQLIYYCTYLLSRKTCVSEPFSSTGCPSTVDSGTSGTCLQNRCLVMVIFVTHE
jgi:hypothetical protein